MNPLTNVKNLQKLNQRELELGLTNKKSWHDQYKDSAWIFVGGLPYDLTEGDIVCVFSQYGELVNINLVRDQKSGKSKGFCFICYEDQRSTVLTVDNFNGIKLLGRTLRVDHVEEYRKPKEHGDEDDITMKLRTDGCAPQIPQSPERVSSEEEPLQIKVKVKKEKKIKKEKKVKKKKKAAKRKSSSSESSSDSETDYNSKRVKKEHYDSETDYKKFNVKVKKEKKDPGYDKAEKTNARQKRAHSSDDGGERRKSSKYDRDGDGRRVGRDDRQTEYEDRRNRGQNFRDETDRPRSRDETDRIRSRDEADRTRFRDEADRTQSRDYGDDERNRGKYREANDRDYDRRSDRDRGERGGGNYGERSDRYRQDDRNDRGRYDREYSDRNRSRDSRR